MAKEYKNSFEVHELPYIEMYGGETLNWEVDIVNDDGTYFKNEEILGCDAVLTLTPFKTTSGIGTSAIPAPVSLKKIGYVRNNSEGNPTIEFLFYEEDTIALRGKYVYQIDVRIQSNLRISQGYIYIKQNNNRNT